MELFNNKRLCKLMGKRANSPKSGKTIKTFKIVPNSAVGTLERCPEFACNSCNVHNYTLYLLKCALQLEIIKFSLMDSNKQTINEINPTLM